jgi:hypothetical protein
LWRSVSHFVVISARGNPESGKPADKVFVDGL